MKKVFEQEEGRECLKHKVNELETEIKSVRYVQG
jgi:hypothetical protein